MPRKSTGLTDRLTLPMRPELLREIDQVRGDVPRVAWIRRELALAVTRHRPRPRKRDGKSKWSTRSLRGASAPDHHSSNVVGESSREELRVLLGWISG